jgi:predicted branched-subunit amino acid permease
MSAPVDTRPAVAGQLPHAWADYVGGARAMVPWLLGVVPFGLVIGVSAARADVPGLAGWLGGPLLFGGSAHVATLQLLDAHAAAAVVVVAALAINARLVLYSAAMAPRWRGRSRAWQALAAGLLVDPSFAVGEGGYETFGDGARADRHYLGGALVLGAAWLVAITVGMVAGAGVPEGLHLDMVIPLFLTGEVVHHLRDRSTTVAALVAGSVAALATATPQHLGPILALGAGITAGVLTERSTP